MTQKLYQKYHKDKANALILVVLSVPLIMLLFAFNLNIGKDISTKNIFNNTVQSATEAAVKTVNNRSVLGNESVQAFVNTYDKLITNPDTTSGSYVGGGMEAEVLRSRGVCGTMEINGAERVLPYMEITLSENRGNSSSSFYHTETWKLDGTTRSVTPKNLGNVKYKVIQATVWEATPNFLSFTGLEDCHLQKATKSAIAFGSQSDLEEQITLSNKVQEPRDHVIELEECLATGKYSISDKIGGVPEGHRMEVISVKAPDGTSLVYDVYDEGSGITHANPLELRTDGKLLNYLLDKEVDYNKYEYVNIEYAFSRIGTDGKTIRSSAATIEFRDSRTALCTISWPSLEKPWIGLESTELSSDITETPSDYAEIYGRKANTIPNATDFSVVGSEFKTAGSLSPSSGIGVPTSKINWVGKAREGLERKVTYTVTHIETGAKRKYTTNIFIHPLQNVSNISYNYGSSGGTYTPVSGNAPSTNMSKYFNYSLVPVSTSYTTATLENRTSIKVVKAANAPLQTAGPKTDKYEYQIKSAYTGRVLKSYPISINYTVPAPLMTYGVYAYGAAETPNPGKSLEWKLIPDGDRYTYVSKFESIYGSSGLNASICHGVGTKMYVKTVKGRPDIAISAPALKDFGTIKNMSPELTTLLSTPGANIACYMEKR